MIEKEKKRRRGKKTVDLGNEIITLENVSKAYATGAPALNGVNLHINRGDFSLFQKISFHRVGTHIYFTI